MPSTPLTTDVSRLLGPGVFLLSLRGRVIYIGKAYRLIDAIAIHSKRSTRLDVPSFIRTFRFDAVEIIPCDTSRATDLHRALLALHNPIHNRVAPIDISTALPPNPPATLYNFPRI